MPIGMVSLASIVSGLPATARLYEKGAYAVEASSRVLRFVRETGKKGYLVVEATLFHPRSGAQVNDTGLIEKDGASFIVSKVMEQWGVVVHYGDFDGTLDEGDAVRMRIDWNRRYMVMRGHTAGHIVDFAVSKVYDMELMSISASHDVGFGFQEYAGEISEPMPYEVERVANSVVELNAPVIVEYVKASELREKVFGAPNLGKLPRLDTYRVVVIEGINAIPCGGTHVRRTGEVGKIRITGFEKGERSFKVSYSVEDLRPSSCA